jgi:hypothetical protein
MTNNSFNPENYNRISEEKICSVRVSLQPLIGVQLPVLRLPKNSLIGFEPSQIGTIIGTLMDACIPQLSEILPNGNLLRAVGLSKYAGILGDREAYPDYQHISGTRLELKLLYVDPKNIPMKKPPTKREASARLTQKVTVKNVESDNDLLLVIAYQLQPTASDPAIISPTIIDIGLFPVIDCILARDRRLTDGGGKWFGDYETPTVLSEQGKKKLAEGKSLDYSSYGRKKEEGKDLNEDTNFGKLKRIPFKPLQEFLKKHGAA